jgi:hypothetical protein
MKNINIDKLYYNLLNKRISPSDRKWTDWMFDIIIPGKLGKDEVIKQIIELQKLYIVRTGYSCTNIRESYDYVIFYKAREIICDKCGIAGCCNKTRISNCKDYKYYNKIDDRDNNQNKKLIKHWLKINK